MINFTQGNLLEANVEALVNTVNTVGVMGKGIALMFKERFPENYLAYEAACKAGRVRVGHMFVTERQSLVGPRWVINFPTKKHWRQPSKLDWVAEGLVDLKRFIQTHNIQSIAIPPLGSGNGGLDWTEVKPVIAEVLGDLENVTITIYEPTKTYQNVAKRAGVEKLTPARALVAELVRRYSVLGFDCTLLEIQKLAWFLERCILKAGLANPLDLRFSADRYGPYANRLSHLLDALDGSYLHCDKRIGDADPFDIIWFDEKKKELVQAFLTRDDAKPFREALEDSDALIDGFQSPLGMELLATVDWLLHKEGTQPTVTALREGLHRWPGGVDAGARKGKLFDDRLLSLALERLTPYQDNIDAAPSR
jgi:O-acetyl-ADP-ribose deacetylase (regulator of RNase III)